MKNIHFLPLKFVATENREYGDPDGVGWEVELWEQAIQVHPYKGATYTETRWRVYGIVIPNLWTLVLQLIPHTVAWHP